MPNCFVIMPFRPELNFFYKTIKVHMGLTFPEVSVERGDDRVLDQPILKKIDKMIRQADVVIADCSGRNPNVFYELGMAHALDKPVVLITSDAIEEAPTDIRAYEFISYAQLGPDDFLAKLDQALVSIVGNPFAALYPEAIERFNEFCAATNQRLAPSSQEQFEADMMAKHAGGKRMPNDDRKRAEYLIQRLFGREAEIEVLVSLSEWSHERYP